MDNAPAIGPGHITTGVHCVALPGGQSGRLTTFVTSLNRVCGATIEFTPPRSHFDTFESR